MDIKRITGNKKAYLDLLLLGDEQESMIDRYLARGELFVLYDGALPVTICVVTDEGGGEFEIKNLATRASHQNRGHAGRIIEHVCSHCKAQGGTAVTLGTGEEPGIVAFYEHRGFRYSHRIENFFTDNYDAPIIENGVLLTDMVYFRRAL